MHKIGTKISCNKELAKNHVLHNKSMQIISKNSQGKTRQINIKLQIKSRLTFNNHIKVNKINYHSIQKKKKLVKPQVQDLAAMKNC